MMKNNLTEGNILKKLIILAIPIMGTSLIQMAYSLTNMIWIGILGSRGVTSIGAAGFYMWFAFAFILIPKIGAEVGISQAIGRNDKSDVKNYIRHSIQINVVLAMIYGTVMIMFRKQLIGFFNIQGEDIVRMSVTYLAIVSCGMIFYFLPPVLTAIFNGHGDSRTPFLINTIGLVTNMILDPVLILGIGPFPKMGVSGAGIATVFAQFIVVFVFIYVIVNKTNYFKELNFLQKPDWSHIRGIVRFGIPAAIQSGIFTVIAMTLTRILSRWGSTPVAVQSVGAQIESISWMTAGGFQTALSAFVGQNFGAKKWDRIYKGYFIAIGSVAIIGIIASCMLIFFPKEIFSIFIREKSVVESGIVYLRILGLSQLFMCIEITTAGAFNGLGKTIPPSVVGIVLNAMRIPMAILLSINLGVNGVWWSISISSILKGIILTSWFVIFIHRHKEVKNKFGMAKDVA